MNVLRDFDDSKMRESIFGQDEPWNKSTEPGRMEKPHWHEYALAYKIAADRLVDNLRRGPISELYQVFPIIFLYRHYLELKIKEILRALLDWDGRRDEQIKQTHSLHQLWHQARLLLEQFDQRVMGEIDETGREEGAEMVKAIGLRVKEFDEIDPDSQNFRYPENVEAKRNPPKLLERHEIRHVKEVVNALDMNLDGISVGLDEIISNLTARPD